MNEYFPLLVDQACVLSPLKATSMDGKVDVIIQVEGGGQTARAEPSSWASPGP